MCVILMYSTLSTMYKNVVYAIDMYMYMVHYNDRDACWIESIMCMIYSSCLHDTSTATV